MDIPALNHHVGSTERAFVAHVNDLNDFYLHSESVHESLVNLGRDLYNEYSESYTKTLGINEILNVGDYCACPSESEDWYRGLIRQLDTNGHAIVFKIDYGDVQCIPIQFLRPLQQRFFNLPRRAFHCSLVSLIRPNNGWPLEVINEFHSRLTTTFLYAKFISYNEIRDILEVEITEKSSKTPLNKDFEQYQIPRSISQMNDKLVYKYIPMETLDCNQPNQIRLLYYLSPNRFYVYLREKTNSHLSFQNDLQKSIQNLHPISSPRRYQPIAAQDNHAVWHRAIILDINSDPTKISVYFIDIGQREYILMNNIRSLPEEFQRKPGFAIPCCLNNVCPLNGNEQSIWKSNDPVHDEFNRLMVNNVTCEVCIKHDQLYYDVNIDIPKIGDLSTFLFDKNLVSHPIMRQQSQRPSYNTGQNSYIRAQLTASGISPLRSQTQPRFSQPNEYNNSNNIPHQQSTRMLNPSVQTSIRPQPSNISTTNSSSTVHVVPPQDGFYKIIQVRSATEFYGLSQQRENEFIGLSKHLSDYYNNSLTDSSVNVNIFLEDELYVTQQDDRYYRVLTKRREGETRISVKLIDRGDEIIVDTSELLQIDSKFRSIPAFAQPFRLNGFDESQNSATTTQSLKKMILNQIVRITQHASTTINGFYPVEITINNQSVNKAILSNDKKSLITSPTSNNTRPSFNQPQLQPPHYESKVFHNSTRYDSTMSQNLSGRTDIGQRSNDVLPAPQKILTAPTRAQPGRFSGGTNSTVPSSSNEPPPRFQGFTNRNQQSQVVDSSTWNSDQNNKSTSNTNNFSNQQTFPRQQPNSSQSTINNRTDDNRASVNNNSNNQQLSSYEQKRSFDNDDRNDKQMSGNNENGFRKSGFSNRGGFNNDRGGSNNDRGGPNNDRGGPNNDRGGPNNDRGGSNNDRGGFNSDRGGFNNDRGGPNNDRGGFNSDRGGFNNDRGGPNNDRGGSNNDRGGFNNDRGGFNSDRGGRGGFQGRNNENNSQSSGGFSKRTEGFNERGGGRGGGYSDRNNFNRNHGDDQSQGFTNNRGGFRGEHQNRRDQGENGEFGRRGRGGRGGPRGGGFTGGARDRGTDEIQLSLDNKTNDSTKPFSGWPSTRSIPSNFEAGDRFIENTIPQETFKFVVSHIETANQFYIQLLSKGDQITTLTDRLQTEYKQSPEVNINAFKLNQSCLAKSTDGCWYRAIVLSTGVSELKVRFVDFGDTTEVDSKKIRPISKAECISPPYAYECTFKNVQVIENVKKENIIDKCAGKEFNGKILMKNSDGKFLLESNELLNILLEINAIKVKSEIILKRIKCLIAHIEPKQQEFYIQDDEDTVIKVAELIEDEEPNAPILSLDEIKELKPNAIVLANYDDLPFRGIIQSHISDEDVNICFIDYGNTSSCPKNSLKRSSEQLNSYPHQAKHCHLYGISSNEIDNALKYLGDHTDSENIEISIINEKDHIYNVLVYIDNKCINEKFGFNPETLVKEQSSNEIVSEEQTKSSNEVLLEQETKSLNEVVSEQETKSSNEIVLEEEIKSSNEIVLEHETKSSDESVSERETESSNEIVSEQETKSSNEVVSEQETKSSNETLSEQEIKLSDEIVLEQETKSSTEVALEQETKSLNETSSEEETKLSDEILSETSTVNKSEIEESLSKYHQGFLTYLEQTKPFVYLQLYPESDPIMDQINTLIEKITREDKHNSSYEIGDHIIAKFTEDDNYYRARIESYSSESELYTVYFLDYGNFDENVPIDNLYSYTDDLKQIEPQAHGYLLDKIDSQTWNNHIRTLIEKYLNDVVEFYYTDENNNSIIHIKFDNENEIYNIQETTSFVEQSIKQNQTFQANISSTDNDCFYIHILSDKNLHPHEIDQILQICNKEQKTSWGEGDLCIVSNEENKYVRGKILTINNNTYDVKCIDYGNILKSLTIDHLYELPNEDIYQQSSLAHQCRLYGINDENQIKAIKEIIKTIPITERITITVENIDDSCLFVILIRENNEIINEQYLNENKQESDNDETKEIVLPDSVIINEQSINENLSITNNQTIDFGENDPSTIIKDETNNSITSN